MPDHEVQAFASGVHNLLNPELIPADAAQDAKNWYTQDGRTKLMPGRQRIKGHPSIDFAPANCWGMPVKACVEGLVYSVINRGNPDLSKYRAVYQLVKDEKGDWYEVSYGHLNDILVKPGQVVKTGDVIGTVGNTGPVYRGGVLVTSAEKLLPSHPGAHLHAPQVRPVERVQILHGTALSDGFGVYRDEEGYYFQVKDPKNGYNGCVDPMTFFIKDSEKIAAVAAATPDPKQKNLLQIIIAWLVAQGD